ncbi:unnamed protein product [Oikopleura dioica]|uniref:Peptidase S1 domain-containing protein n=1 Tax=Oikopleura dioica TaxID=34765 RepID=E4XUE9_OIKDI|nr:unnamed protein product [Oikopleura dioica]
MGGKSADPGNFPWQAALALNMKIFCGGTLVSPTTIISAAHCLTDYVKPEHLFVSVGHTSSNHSARDFSLARQATPLAQIFKPGGSELLFVERSLRFTKSMLSWGCRIQPALDPLAYSPGFRSPASIVAEHQALGAGVNAALAVPRTNFGERVDAWQFAGHSEDVFEKKLRSFNEEGRSHDNLQNILMNFDVIPEFLRRKKLTDTADFIEKHQSLMEIQFLASILVYQHLVQPWWEQIRAMSDTVSYQSLKEKMCDSIENVLKAASPAVAIRYSTQNLMIGSNI